MPQSYEAIQTLFLFVIPGFIVDSIENWFITRASRDSSRLIMEYVGWSGVSYAVFSMLTAFWAEPWRSATLLVVGPVVLGIVVGLFRALFEPRLRQRLRITKNPFPKAWDYVFCNRVKELGTCFVIVTLLDGRMLGGCLDGNWHASEYPASEDLYISKVCCLNDSGQFLSYSDCAGILIRHEEIKYIEFFCEGEEENGRQEETP